MPVQTVTLTPESNPSLESGQTLPSDYLARLSEPLGPPVPWNRTTWLGLASLVIFWAVRIYATWATWGDLTIDSGHEMYVPVVLLEGKTLYRDVWYMHGPLGPYLNSYLYHLFGIHLNVLYWAGSLTALGCAVLLYVIGMQLSSWLVGWTVAAMMLVQAFNPGIFSFGLPYSFDAAYGSLTACLFLYLAIRAVRSRSAWWTFGAATAAAVVLLFKLEMGVACYAALGVTILIRLLTQRSWKSLATDLATAIPGAAVCILVARWMISLKDVRFITEENIVSWPGTYYMKTFGKAWMAQSGFDLSFAAISDAVIRAVLLGLTLLLFYRWLHRVPSNASSPFWRAAILLVGINVLVYVFPSRLETLFRGIFFPQDMVLYVGLAAPIAWLYFLRQPSRQDPSMVLLLTFSGLLAFRLLFGMKPSGYPIFYNGPVLVAFLLLALAFVPRQGREPGFIFRAECLICFACLSAAVMHAVVASPSTRNFVPLATERGVMRVPPEKAEGYRLAIAFMRDRAAHGEAVLSLPEDTSLYFFSATHCPTRLWLFGPGLLVPGRMTDEFFAELEGTPVKYLLWSTRTFAETGAPNFGVDFDRDIGDYLKSHYHFVRPVAPPRALGWGWNAGIWERKP